MMAYNSDIKSREQERIRTSLERQGRDVVHITTKTSSNGQGSPNIFEITYSTPDNQLYKVRCICWRQRELFWTEPVLVRQGFNGLDRPMEQAVFDAGEFSAENAPLNKEIIINGLTSGSVEERVSMVNQIGELTQVDELVTYILMDMSRDDPAVMVRAAAIKTLRQLNALQPTVVA